MPGDQQGKQSGEDAVRRAWGKIIKAGRKGVAGPAKHNGWQASLNAHADAGPDEAKNSNVQSPMGQACQFVQRRHTNVSLWWMAGAQSKNQSDDHQCKNHQTNNHMGSQCIKLGWVTFGDRIENEVANDQTGNKKDGQQPVQEDKGRVIAGHGLAGHGENSLCVVMAYPIADHHDCCNEQMLRCANIPSIAIARAGKCQRHLEKLRMIKDRDELAESVRKVRQTSVGWHIQRLSSQLDRAMNEALAPHGLTIQKFAILMTLIESDGLTQTELGSRFSAPAYAITRVIDGLETDGFLQRRLHPTSRRTNTVHATAKLIDLAPTLLGIVKDVNGRMLEALDPQERDATLRLLAGILGNNSL